MNIGEKISVFFTKLADPNNLIAYIVMVIVFAVLYFYLIKFYMDNGTEIMAILFSTVMVISAAIVSMAPTMDSAIFLVVPSVFIVLTAILYSVELKRIILAKRNAKLLENKHGNSRAVDEEKVNQCITEIIKALQNMSKNDVGAIIVLSTGNVPNQIIDSGVRLDSDISSELIESVFFPKTPLHDGAMIISDTKIVAAGCFLPLSQNVDGIPKDLGTRHRAGIGVTETIDVMSLIVSEETGIISVAKAGKITRYADYERLKQTLSQYYWQELDSIRR